MRTVPGVRKAVKWNSPMYGIEDRGWFLGVHTFTHYVKVAFFRGAALRPVPPGPSKDKDTRYLDIREDDELSRALEQRFGRTDPSDQRFRHLLPDVRRLREADALVARYVGTFQVYLYRSEGKVGVMARTHLLDDAWSHTDHLDSLGTGTKTVDTLINQLEPRYPAIP